LETKAEKCYARWIFGYRLRITWKDYAWLKKESKQTGMAVDTKKKRFCMVNH
jgi:hypothetical protein